MSEFTIQTFNDSSDVCFLVDKGPEGFDAKDKMYTRSGQKIGRHGLERVHCELDIVAEFTRLKLGELHAVSDGPLPEPVIEVEQVEQSVHDTPYVRYCDMQGEFGNCPENSHDDGSPSDHVFDE